MNVDLENGYFGGVYESIEEEDPTTTTSGAASSIAQLSAPATILTPDEETERSTEEQATAHYEGVLV